MGRDTGIRLGDVTVRVPAKLDTIEETAGWIYGVIARAMEERGWVGEPAVLYRSTTKGKIVMFHQGLMDPYTGILPHDLVEPEDEAPDRPHRPPCAACKHSYDMHQHNLCQGKMADQVSGCPCPGYEPRSYDIEPGAGPGLDYPYSLDPMYVTDSAGNTTLLTDERGAKNYLAGSYINGKGKKNRRVWKVKVIPLAEMEVEVPEPIIREKGR